MTSDAMTADVTGLEEMKHSTAPLTEGIFANFIETLGAQILEAIEKNIGPMQAEVAALSLENKMLRDQLDELRNSALSRMRGMWRAGQRYRENDWVAHANALWICGVDHTSAMPGMNEDWHCAQERFTLGLDAKLLEKLGDLEAKVKRLDDFGDVGPYESGRRYDAGNITSFDGSAWICNRATGVRPGDGPQWRLLVKRGRDGKDIR